MNIQQQTASEVDDIETVMADNEELYPPSPQDILNVFAAEDLSSRSSSIQININMHGSRKK